MKADLIIHNAGQVVTCASGGRPKRRAAMQDVGIVVDGAVAVKDGRIAAVGTSEQILADHTAAETIDAGKRIVCPGFVDPHTHIVFAGDRLNEFELKIKGADYLDILANGGGIISTVRYTRDAPFDQLVNQSRERLDKMLACGTTTAEIKTGYGLETEAEMKMLDVIAELDRTHAIDIVPTFLAAHAVPPEYKDEADRYVDLICSEMLPRVRDWYSQSKFYEKTPCFVDVFCENGAFTLEQSRRLFSAARKLKLLELKAHVDEFTNLGGSRLAIQMGATSIDHLDAISEEEIYILADSNTVAIVTPTVNFNFGSAHFADARKLIDCGCVVALSTDYNPGSAPCPSQPMAMAIACRYQKLLPSEAMNAATINAAYSIGMGELVGSIEVGKLADMLILRSIDYRSLSNEFGGEPVDAIIKRGVLLGPVRS